MIVLGAIGVLLILMLTAVGLLMYSAKAKPEAPLRSPCPDYWSFDGSGCKLPATVNRGEINTASTPHFSTATTTSDNTVLVYKDSATPSANYYLNPKSDKWSDGSLYAGMTEVCAKGKWARDLGIVWDGYTNTTEC